MEAAMEYPIKGMFVQKYGNLTNAAKQMKWSTRKMNYIANGRQCATVRDIEEMAKALEINDMRVFMSVFFPGVSI